jgi:hypothetical protein
MTVPPAHSDDDSSGTPATRNDGDTTDAFEDAMSSLPAAPPMPKFPEIPGDLRRAAEDQPPTLGSANLAGLARGWGMALDFVFSILAAWLIGFAIDRWAGLGTAPWGSLAGLAIGLTASLVRITRQMNRQ